LAFRGELDNSINCAPPRCAMTVLRFNNRLHRKTTDRSSTRHRASRARATPSTKPSGTGRIATSPPPTRQEQQGACITAIPAATLIARSPSPVTGLAIAADRRIHLSRVTDGSGTRCGLAERPEHGGAGRLGRRRRWTRRPCDLTAVGPCRPPGRSRPRRFVQVGVLVAVASATTAVVAPL